MDNPTHVEKLAMLLDWFVQQNDAFSQLSNEEADMTLKVMLLNIAERYNVDVITLLAALAKSYDERVIANAHLSTEEMQKLCLDELARQEEQA